MDILKSSWRLTLAFWGGLTMILGGLYSAGFVDVPANAKDVHAIKVTVERNGSTLRRMTEHIGSIDKIETVNNAERRSIAGRLESIEINQRETSRDIKGILHALRPASQGR